MRRWLRKGRNEALAKLATSGSVRPSSDVLTARKDGTAVLLDLRREIYLSLDEAGSIIWSEVEQGSPRAQIYERLAAEYEAPVELLRADADRFLGEMLERGLVEAA
jgi:hypothetical protein